MKEISCHLQTWAVFFSRKFDIYPNCLNRKIHVLRVYKRRTVTIQDCTAIVHQSYDDHRGAKIRTNGS